MCDNVQFRFDALLYTLSTHPIHKVFARPFREGRVPLVLPYLNNEKG